MLFFVSRQVTPGGVGTPLAMQLQAANAAQARFDEAQAAEILIAGAGTSPDDSAFAAVYDVLLHTVPHRFVDVRHTAVFPAHTAVVLLDPAAGEAASLYADNANFSESIPLRLDEGHLAVLIVAATAVPQPQHLLDPPSILTNWAAFGGYDAPIKHEDGTATWPVYWYAGEPSPADYHMFHHLFNADGDLIGQVDAPVFPARQWQENDLIITVSRLPWPADGAHPYTMRAGMYTYPDLTPVLIFDVAGNPYTDALEILIED